MFLNQPTSKKTKPSMFQVLLLDNNKGQDVKVQESDQVDFCVVKEHLKNGGSVFITSRNQQKIATPKNKSQTNYTRSRRNMGSLFQRNFRTSFV